MTNLSVLDRDMYAEAEVARLLRLPQATLHYWLEGGERRGKSYKPVLRVEPRGDRSVTWAEFVEAALLREYRRTRNKRTDADVPLRRRVGGCVTTPFPAGSSVRADSTEPSRSTA